MSKSLVKAVEELICGDSLTRAPVPNSPEWIENVLAVRDRVAELEKELATATEDEAREWTTNHNLHKHIAELKAELATATKDEAREWTTNHNLREHIVELEAELAAQSFKEYAAAQTIEQKRWAIDERDRLFNAWDEWAEETQKTWRAVEEHPNYIYHLLGMVVKLLSRGILHLKDELHLSRHQAMMDVDMMREQLKSPQDAPDPEDQGQSP